MGMSSRNRKKCRRDNTANKQDVYKYVYASNMFQLFEFFLLLRKSTGVQPAKYFHVSDRHSHTTENTVIHYES